ncbi:MAG: hypothetical protein H6696_17555 [Deferribacteres bacterium]|nr:hypothetical protein [Deferribacteres bacterium]
MHEKSLQHFLLIHKLIRHILLVLFAAVSFLQAQDQSGSPSPISLENIKHHLAYLASDDLKGRATGSTGAKLAADYIASQLADFGITPFGDHNTYFQNIPMHGSKAMKDSRLRFIARGKREFSNMKRLFTLRLWCIDIYSFAATNGVRRLWHCRSGI